MIVFSIPVHEHEAVVMDLLENIHRFVPGSGVVLHVARQWVSRDRGIVSRLENIPRVAVNPRHYWTSWGDGIQLKAHVDNFDHAVGAFPDMTHMALMASNELFIRPGVDGYIRSHDVGCFATRVLPTDTGWVQSSARRDGLLARMMEKRGRMDILNSQVEGTFYRKEPWAGLCRDYREMAWREFGPLIPYSQGDGYAGARFSHRLRRHFPARFYPKEEIYGPTFLAGEGRRCDPYCYALVQPGAFMGKAEVDEILAGNEAGMKKYKVETHREIYSVKRVDRDGADTTRAYIRSLPS